MPYLVPYMADMLKTTVYLDPGVALALKQLATVEGRSQAELIRDALTAYTRRSKRPLIPGLGEFDSGQSNVSERAEEILRQASRTGGWRRSHGAGR
jgi:predicted transcriptional regulator